MKAKPVVALAGQPNTGKSTIFNRLTGLNQHVGNWPGKTVAKKSGIFDLEPGPPLPGEEDPEPGLSVHLVDLPGTYGLTANSLEERIARDFLIREAPDAVIVVVDASQLTRSLYMAAEVLSLPLPVVVALNMMDVAEDSGAVIDPGSLERAMGVPVVPMTAARDRGMDLLHKGLNRLLKRPGKGEIRGPDFKTGLGPLFTRVAELAGPGIPKGLPPYWTQIKLMEQDREVLDLMELESAPRKELETLIAQGDPLGPAALRYQWIEKGVAAARLSPPPRPSLKGFDYWATHPLWGKGIALGMLLVSALAAYILCLPPMLLGLGLLVLPVPVRPALEGVVPDWLIAMVCDGLLTGMGVATCVLAFISGVFLVMGFLEDIGYLARLAYLFHRFMGRLGLQGKSFIPLCMGFVCNIMAVGGSRVIDGWRQRLITLLLAPLIPCKGLLVVVSFISLVFFGAYTPLVFVSLFTAMAGHLVFTSFLLRKILLPGEDHGLIMELPPYHKPNWRTIRNETLIRVKGFYRSGYWLIVAVAFLTWAGVYYPAGDIETSYLARAGRFLEPLGVSMGMDWRLLLTFMVAFSSKEATLGAMAVIFGATTSSRTAIEGLYMDPALALNLKTQFGSFLGTAGISRASALAFVFALFYSLPCIGTLAVIRTESGSLKWTLAALTYYFATSVLAGTLVYQVSRPFLG